MHVTLRLAANLGTLRKRRAYDAIRRATIVVAARHDARIIHVSIQATHVHLLVEANSASELGEGMRRFAISAARQLNALNSTEAGRRRGQVFPQRYHAEVLTVPRQARHALAYVLNNWRHHRGDRSVTARTWRVDPYSSAGAFDGWAAAPRGLEEPPPWPELAVGRPVSWLLLTGWRRYGKISPVEVPGSPS